MSPLFTKTNLCVCVCVCVCVHIASAKNFTKFCSSNEVKKKERVHSVPILMYSCITYIEKNLRVDCEFPETHKIPGPFCEYKQDGRLMGSTYPNTPVHMIPPIETRRRANVTLVPPNICRLTWMPMSDDRAYTYTCRVYQGSTWKENSMAFHQSEFKMPQQVLLNIC
uniref:Si:ch211-215c18.3 n=1 Tax=Sinocyclocheilus rhinocerous TaxID=307959 RepID=A0A673JAY3_9TELE